MKLNFSTGNLLIYGSILTLLFIFSLIFSFLKQDLMLVSQDYYAEEVAYDQHKKELKNADSQGTFLHAEKQDKSVLLQIPVEIAKKLKSGELKVYFPSLSSNDQVFQFVKNDSGLYRFEIKNALNRPYTLKVKFSDSTQTYSKSF